MVSFYFLVRYNWPFSGGIMWSAASSLRHRINALTPASNVREAAPRPLLRVPNRFSGIQDFPYSGFESKIGERFSIEGTRGRWDTKNNPRDYRIARNFGSRKRDWRTILGTLLVLGPLRTQQSTGCPFRISFQSDWPIDNGFFNGPIMMRIQILVHRWGPRTKISALFRRRS